MNTLNNPTDNKQIPLEIPIQNININQQVYPNNQENVNIQKVNQFKGVYVPIKQNQAIIPIQKILDVKQNPQTIIRVSKVESSPKIFYVQPTVSVNASQIQTKQISQVSQYNQISKVGNSSHKSQISQSSLISQVNVIPDQEKIISHSIISTKAEQLPDINTSQISASKVMPLKILPQINRQTKVKVLPVKILPPILVNNEINSNLTTILQIKSSDNIYEKFPEYEYGK